MPNSEAKVGPESTSKAPVTAKKAALKRVQSTFTKANEEDEEPDELFQDEEPDNEKDIVEAYRVAVKKFLATTTTGTDGIVIVIAFYGF